MIKTAVYLICALTSSLCAVLLFREHRRSRARLSLWSAVAFCGLALNNVLLYVDLVLVPSVDLAVVRTLPALIGVGLLVGIHPGASMSVLYVFLSGAVMVACAVAGMFFFRFWSAARDRLLLFFAIAFWLMAVERVAIVVFRDPDGDAKPLMYLIRLAAFMLILAGIADKNRGERNESQGGSAREYER